MTSKRKAEAAPQKQKVTVEITCDTGRLYGSLKEAIPYLAEIAAAYPGTDIGLDEIWTGYEDMHMAFTYSRDETDEEFASRLAAEEVQRKAAERDREKLRQRQADLDELKRLQRKLGM